MKFAKIAFGCAGIWGVLLVTPMYFMYGKVETYTPPTPTHPEFYFGFVGVTLAWQFVFLVIASDPLRYRPLMFPSILEKISYVGASGVLYFQNRVGGLQLGSAVPDLVLCLLFIVALFKTSSSGTGAFVK